MISARLLDVVRCPDCGGRLEGAPPELTCAGCARRYAASPDGYLDLRPSAAFDETTKYVDAALHEDARHERVSPPLLSAAIRNDMLRSFLRLSADDLVIDLGCGSGRALVWNQDAGAWRIGVDVAPYFAEEARCGVDLVLADLRRLPFASNTFSAGWSLDVLEHLSPETLALVLAEAARVLRPEGRLFVYSHVRRNSRLAAGLRLINRLARGLERLGLIDLAQERLRKSDHLNPLPDVPALERAVRRAGFRVARLRYYTPLVGGFVENILVRLAERAMTRRAARRGADAPARAARHDAKRRIAARGPAYAALGALTAVMKLDVVLFGRIRSGPFFALLVKE
jgi:SAM-dependent methyltransferase